MRGTRRRGLSFGIVGVESRQKFDGNIEAQFSPFHMPTTIGSLESCLVKASDCLNALTWHASWGL